MDPISLYLERDILPEEKSEAEKVQRKAPRFWLSHVIAQEYASNPPDQSRSELDGSHITVS